MKRLAIFTAVYSLGLTGCVSTTYHKTIEVTKDANGNITGTRTIESIVQPNQSGWPVKFDYLKGVQSGE
jgi:hypothetical protein